jgi:hypothetical protein
MFRSSRSHGRTSGLDQRAGHRVETPSLEDLVFYAGLGALVGVGHVELPIALALGVGRLLIGATNRPGLEALGATLEAV